MIYRGKPGQDIGPAFRKGWAVYNKHWLDRIVDMEKDCLDFMERNAIEIIGIGAMVALLAWVIFGGN